VTDGVWTSVVGEVSTALENSELFPALSVAVAVRNGSPGIGV
jgi:hypothetical protein